VSLTRVEPNLYVNDNGFFTVCAGTRATGRVSRGLGCISRVEAVERRDVICAQLAAGVVPPLTRTLAPGAPHPRVEPAVPVVGSSPPPFAWFSDHYRAASVGLGDNCPIEAGIIGLLADGECVHGSLPSDHDAAACGCWDALLACRAEGSA
jgi:hypothetical protein